MARSHQTSNKKEREKIKQKKRQDKEKRKEERKASQETSSFESMIAYVDEYGQLTSTPPDLSKRVKINADEIETSVPKRQEVVEQDENSEGTMTYFDESKGYGFILDTHTHENIFSHISGHIDIIKENDRVNYKKVKGSKGLNAIDVRVIH